MVRPQRVQTGSSSNVVVPKSAAAVTSPSRDRKNGNSPVEESVSAFLEESANPPAPAAATTTSTTAVSSPRTGHTRSSTLVGSSGTSAAQPAAAAAASSASTSSSSSSVAGVEDARGYNLQKLLSPPAGFCDRFSAPDSESNILFLPQSSPEEEKQIKGGTLSKLVERLTLPDHGDPTFVRTFLLTYRSFTSPMELLQLMINRFYTPIADENDMDMRRSVQKPIRLRLFAVLKVNRRVREEFLSDVSSAGLDHKLQLRF
jgi:hypothetical protein